MGDELAVACTLIKAWPREQHLRDVRNGLIEAVTREDVARVAKRLLKPEALLVSIVGKPNLSPEPEGLPETDDMAPPAGGPSGRVH